MANDVIHGFVTILTEPDEGRRRAGIAEASPSRVEGGVAGRSTAQRLLLAANYAALFAGSMSSTLLTRFYFMHGGSSRWLSTVVQSAGFPFLFPIVYISSHSSTSPSRPFSDFTPRLLVLSLFVGLLIGVNNFLISWGISYLPASTASLLLSSQLAFNLVLSVLLVGERLRFYNVNCVVLLTLASVLLALGSPMDRPKGVTRAQFFIGLSATLGAALLFALYLPVMELIYRRVASYRMVAEMQTVIQAVATVFAVTGMAAAGGFKEVGTEAASRFDLGKAKYWVTVGFMVVCWQLCFMGTAGMVFLTTSLNSGICMTALLSMNVLGGVLVLGDEFGGLKAVSTVLCLWGFFSYLYGGYKKKKEEENRENREREREVKGEKDLEMIRSRRVEDENA